jgi:hypothetical protein
MDGIADATAVPSRLTLCPTAFMHPMRWRDTYLPRA